jgi:hypothetical protein
MQPKSQESSANFILRVEQQSRQINGSEKAMLHCFKVRLDVAMQSKVEAARKAKLAATG